MECSPVKRVRFIKQLKTDRAPVLCFLRCKAELLWTPVFGVRIAKNGVVGAGGRQLADNRRQKSGAFGLIAGDGTRFKG
jgi:hypothetical protein